MDVRAARIRDFPEAWTSVKHGLWRKEPGCLMLEFIILPTPEEVRLLLASLTHVVAFNSRTHCLNPAVLRRCPVPSVISKAAGREEGPGLWSQQTWVQILNILFTSDVALRKIYRVLSSNMRVRVPAS